MGHSTEKAIDTRHRDFLVEVWGNRLTLMGGLFAVIMWAIAAFAEPIPIPIRLSFAVAGALAFYFACYATWKKEREKANRIQDKLDVIREGRSWTEPDAERENKRLELRRWIARGKDLMTKIHDEIRTRPGPFFSNQLGLEIHEWYNAADAFIQSDYPDFLEKFRSDKGMPPMRADDLREQHQKDVFRRLERFRQLKTRFEPDESPDN